MPVKIKMIIIFHIFQVKVKLNNISSQVLLLKEYMMKSSKKVLKNARMALIELETGRPISQSNFKMSKNKDI
jgi:hypothetical protein